MDTENTPLAWGEYEYNIDDKYRLQVPTEFRAKLGDELIGTRGPDGTILLLTPAVWQEIERRIGTQILEKHSHFLQRMLGIRASLHPDAAGRVILPKALRDYAGLDVGDRVVWVGQGNKVELWRRDAWQAYIKGNSNAEQLYGAIEQVRTAEVAAL